MTPIKLDVSQRRFDGRFEVWAFMYRKQYECEIVGRWVLISVNRVRELAVSNARKILNQTMQSDKLEFGYV